MDAIYDTKGSNDFTLESLLALYKTKNATNVYFKLLSPNDNSKNQPYMANHLTDLSFIPTGEINESSSNSQKTSNPKRKIKYSIELDFSWLSHSGKSYRAPNTKFIYYPQYPEVRLSGFISGSKFDMGGWMDPSKKDRNEGRVLIFAISPDKKIFAYLATPNSAIANEITTINSINSINSIKITSVISKIAPYSKNESSKNILLQELKRIHKLGWIESKRLNKNGDILPYKAQNGGGYTLEAELGIKPNGYSDPDFLGWEIKQFGVTRCDLINSKALTLMTPEPNGGFYFEQGVEAFVRKYGYLNLIKPNRMDFTGRHIFSGISKKTGLSLEIYGFDIHTKQITNADGYVALIDKNGNVASCWSFPKLMKHWNKKHSKAVYIPSISNNTSTIKQYQYCSNIRLFEGTTFTHLLNAFISSHVYYDPGIKLEHINTTPTNKRRSQFRIKSKLLNWLYTNQIDIDINST